MERMLRDKKTLLILLLPALIIFLIFIPVPAIVSVLLSFFNWDLISDMKFIGLENYRFLFVDDYVFGMTIKNTLIFLFGSIILQLPLAFLLANMLSRKMKGSKFFKNVIFLPVTFSGVAVSLMFYFVYHPEIGLINQFLRLLGMQADYAWIGQESTALWAVIITLAWQWTGYHMVIYMAGITNIPLELMEAAKIDGCTNWQITRHIITPLLAPILKVSAVLITTSSLKSFDMIFVMTYGGPNHASEVIATHMYTKTFAQMKYGYGSALSTILLFLNIFSTVAINKMFSKSDNAE